MKKLIAILLTFTMLFALAAGCKQAETPAATKTDAGTAAKATDAPKTDSTKPAGPVKIVMWHSMSGEMGDTLTKMADKFNASRTDVQIELQYQGSYSDALTKYKSTAKADLPDLYMCQAESSGYMMDSGTAVAIQDYIDRDKFDISVLEPDVINYYTVDGKLMNLGFGRTIVGFIYNVEALAKAGYSDPYAQIKTWDQLIEASEKIVDQGICQYGAAITPGGWMVEFFASTANKQLIDNNNGRDGLATKSIIDQNGLGLEWFNLVRKFGNSRGSLTAYTSGGDYVTELGAGNLAMYQTTSSNITACYNAAAGKFTVGFLPLPASTENAGGGLSVGGNSTWMVETGDETRKDAAWEWIKYCMEFDSVLTWATGTGYAAITTEVVESKEYKEIMGKICPTIFNGIDALRKCPAENEGAFMTIFDKHRKLMWTEMQALWADPSYTPEQAVASFVEQVNMEFDLYNASNK